MPSLRAWFWTAPTDRLKMTEARAGDAPLATSCFKRSLSSGVHADRDSGMPAN